MQVLSEDIKDMLEADSSLGLIFPTNLFIGREPAKPDETVTIFDGYGFPANISLDNESIYEYPSFQIRVRATRYDDGMELAKKIVDSFQVRANETWNGTLYMFVRATSNPTLLDWDENGNCRIIINFNTQRR